jgi:hypothetical protein
MANGECVAAGPADADVSEFSYDLPRLSTMNGEEYVVGSDGEILDRGYSATDWAKASPPHVPYHHHYLHGTHLLHSTGTPLTELPLPLSDATQLTENKSDILRWLLKTYLDAALVKKEGAEIYRSQVKAEFTSLLNQLSVPLLDETDWQTVGEINNTWFGRSFPNSEESAADLSESTKKFHRDYSLHNTDDQAKESTGPDDVNVIETEEGWVNGKKVRRIQDYDFVFPTGIISPHTSHVDIDRESILGNIPSDLL